jgi:hypothetical protein
LALQRADPSADTTKMPLLRRRARVAAVGVAAIVLGVAASGWACVAGIGLRIDRELVAPGGEIELTITVAGTPNPPPMAIRLDQLDAPPLLTLAPNGATATVVRVTIPASTPLGQHILIADDEPYPRPVGKYGYEPVRALFSVVDPALAAANPSVQTVLDFTPPVTFSAIRDQLWAMGADLVRMHTSVGEFQNTGGDPLSTVLTTWGSNLAPASGPEATVDSLTMKGQVEREAMGPLAARVTARQVIGLPEPSTLHPRPVASRDRLAAGPTAVAVAGLLLAGAGTAVLARRRRPAV